MASWNPLDGKTVKLIKTLNELGNNKAKIAEVVCRSRATIERVLKGEYDDNGTYIGPTRPGFPGVKTQQPPRDVDLEWLKDVMVKVLYESCLTNNLLKQLIEKWQ